MYLCVTLTFVAHNERFGHATSARRFLEWRALHPFARCAQLFHYFTANAQFISICRSRELNIKISPLFLKKMERTFKSLYLSAISYG